MGSYMTQVNSEFFITAGKIPKVMKAIAGLGSRRYSWVDPNFPVCETLKKMLHAWRWDITFDENGDVNSIEFNGEKTGDDEILFSVIAPFVEEGSFIDMSGNYGDGWSWTFKNGECQEVPVK